MCWGAPARSKSWRLSIAARSSEAGRVFDSWAILAWLQGEAAGNRVVDLLAGAKGASRRASWSAINAGEVYYQLARRRSLELADAFWKDAVAGKLPLTLYRATEARVRRAAALKAMHPVAYADAFAMALALELRQPLVTGDREIQAAAAAAGVALEWLGQRAR